MQAARSLRNVPGSEARAALLSLLEERDEIVRRSPDEGPELAQAIARLRGERARLEGLRALIARKEDLSRFVNDRAPSVRRRALATGRVAARLVPAALSDRDPWMRALALEIGADAAAAKRLARDRAVEVRIACARVTREPEVVVRLLKDKSWRVRLAALRRSERMLEKSLVAPLIEILGEPPGRLRARALAALESLTGAGLADDKRVWRDWWRSAQAGVTLKPPRAAPTHAGSVATVNFRRLPVSSRRLCFVLDASRSMNKPAPGANGTSRWDLVRSDLLGVLDKLPSKARFNVILFRTEPEAWRPRLVAASKAARRSCREWIDAASPGGWTNLFDSIDMALQDDAVDTLYVLTDGVPSRGRETARRAILDEIAFLNRYRMVQINCVQAGSEKGLGKAWHGFLDELAKAHDGQSVRE